ncbi:MAG: AraC family transcriptional regulator [Desulfobacteraceae bacterium]|nr:MAG: AraC family transcriptional regulator [Desulfobacteraceae bacterium]
MTTKHRASVSIHILYALLRYAEGVHIDRAAVCAQAGIQLPDPEKGNQEARIPVAQYDAVWQQVFRQAHDADFGLHFAEATHRFPRGDILSAVMLNSSTIGSALAKLVRYHDLANDFVKPRLERQGGRVHMALEPMQDTPAFDRQYAESLLAHLALTLRALSEGRAIGLEARFVHSRPADTTVHCRIFGRRPVFGSKQNELVIAADDWERPIFLANRELLEQFELLAQERLRRLRPVETWTERVRNLIGKQVLQGEKPGLTATARELALSPRHLQNKLSAEGATFQALLDQVRLEIAQRSLRRPDTTICDVAFLLGFAEQSAFDRAFKRWTGLTPRAYRDKRNKIQSG